MNRNAFGKKTSPVVVDGSFDKSCELNVSRQSLAALKHGKLKVRIKKAGGKTAISRLKVTIGCVSGSINIAVGDDDSSVEFSEGSSGVYDLRLWRNSKIEIGRNTTSNGVKVVCDNSEFICGEDCMFSDSILVQTADQHGIVDVGSGLIINDKYKSVRLGDHVWLGRQCTLTANARIGKGSVIGTGAIVTGKIPEKVIAVGAPARVIKENHTWCRSPISLDIFSKKYIEESC